MLTGTGKGTRTGTLTMDYEQCTMNYIKTSLFFHP